MPLIVHFLNVGRGDCTIIEFPSGRIGIVDIDNLKTLDPDTEKELMEEYHESLEYRLAMLTDRSQAYQLEADFKKRVIQKITDPLIYFDQHLGKYKDIFRLIITHPDMDHMTGLYRLHEQESCKQILNFWHSGLYDFNLADTTDEEWESCPYDKRDWETYKKLRNSVDTPRAIQVHQGDSRDFWNEDGVEVWAPTPELVKLAVEKGSSNIISTILKISYKGKSIVLGGDATAEETWPEIYPKLDMTGIIVLKASHHGRNSGYYGPAVKEMSPWLTITSVGEKAHDATENYRRYSDYTVSLRKAGDIRITIDDSGTLYYPKKIEQHWKEKRV